MLEDADSRARAQILEGGSFGFSLEKGQCIQLGTHGSLTKVITSPCSAWLPSVFSSHRGNSQVDISSFSLTFFLESPPSSSPSTSLFLSLSSVSVLFSDALLSSPPTLPLCSPFPCLSQVFPPTCMLCNNKQYTFQAEEDNIKLGGPRFYSPGVCPAKYAKLQYGTRLSFL